MSDSQNSPREEPAPDDAPRSRMAHVTQFSGYALWTVGAVVISLGVDRLFVSPVLAHRLGTAVFDAFVWMRNFVTFFSNIAGSGFRLHFLRNLVRFDSDEKRQLVRSTAVLVAAITIVAFPIAAFITVNAAPPAARSASWAIFVPFGVYGLARALEFVIAVNLRIQRRFEKLFALRATEGATLVALVLLLPGISLWVVGWMYVASMLLPLLLSCYFNREIVQPGSFFDRPALKRLLFAAPPGAILAGLESAQTLFPTLFLGALATGDGRITAIYAGMGIANVFISPAGFMSQLVLSLLSGKRNFDLSDRQGFLYVSGTVLAAAVASLVAYAAGLILLPFMWPDVAAETRGFFHFIALAIGCLAVRDMLKPFAVKFLAMRMVLLFSAVPLLIQIVGLVVLIPRYQAAGAAIALAVSSLVAMLSWITAFEYLRRTKSAHRQDRSAGQ